MLEHMWKYSDTSPNNNYEKTDVEDGWDVETKCELQNLEETQ